MKSFVDDRELTKDFRSSYYDIIPIDYRLPPLGLTVEIFIEVNKDRRELRRTFLKKISETTYEWDGIEKDTNIIAWRQIDNFNDLVVGEVIIVFCWDEDTDTETIYAGFYDGDDGNKIELFISTDITQNENLSIERCLIKKIIRVNWEDKKFDVLINEPEICSYA